MFGKSDAVFLMDGTTYLKSYANLWRGGGTAVDGRHLVG